MSASSVASMAGIGLKGTGIHLAISGTYSTGKTTTTEALSIATGITRTAAMTAREILADLVPGKRVEDLNARELNALGLRRFEERVHHESGDGAFISDGSVIHEWVYGAARLEMGMNPGTSWYLKLAKSLAGVTLKRYYVQYMDSYGSVAKSRAKRIYDAYVHLPIEFPIQMDGHRPVSESFRALADRMLTDTLDELSIPYIVVGGGVAERVEQICDAFDLPVVVPVDRAVAEAEQRVADYLDLLAADDRVHQAQQAKSLTTRLKYALRY